MRKQLPILLCAGEVSGSERIARPVRRALAGNWEHPTADSELSFEDRNYEKQPDARYVLLFEGLRILYSFRRILTTPKSGPA
jgi:hypothetical protein